MKLLVTGGAGFIGSNFINLNKSHQIINVDCLTYAANLKNIKNYNLFIEASICDYDYMDYIFRTYNPDALINFAAESHVDRSIKDSDKFVKTNILGVNNLLKISLKHRLGRFIQISTDEVYGSIEKGYADESYALSPSSPYASSKASADLMCRAYHTTHKLPVIITRSSNNYGPHQHSEKLIPTIFRKCMNNETIPIYGDGQNKRDWIYVEDNCRAIYTILKKGHPGEIYNIGGDTVLSNIEIATKIRRITNSKSGAEFIEDRKGHDRRYALDSRKIKKLGFKKEVELEEGLIRTYNYYK